MQTRLVWAIKVYYQDSTEIECYEVKWKDAQEQIKLYRENCAYPCVLASKRGKVCPQCNVVMTEVTSEHGDFSIFEKIQGKIKTYNCSLCGTSFFKKALG